MPWDTTSAHPKPENVENNQVLTLVQSIFFKDQLRIPEMRQYPLIVVHQKRMVFV